jgi:hypothetical protein
MRERSESKYLKYAYLHGIQGEKVRQSVRSKRKKLLKNEMRRICRIFQRPAETTSSLSLSVTPSVPDVYHIIWMVVVQMARLFIERTCGAIILSAVLFSLPKSIFKSNLKLNNARHTNCVGSYYVLVTQVSHSCPQGAIFQSLDASPCLPYSITSLITIPSWHSSSGSFPPGNSLSD